MQVVHEKIMQSGSLVALVKQPGILDSIPCAAWGVAFFNENKPCAVVNCRDLTAAANLFHVIEQAIHRGEITSVQEPA